MRYQEALAARVTCGLQPALQVAFHRSNAGEHSQEAERTIRPVDLVCLLMLSKENEGAQLKVLAGVASVQKSSQSCAARPIERCSTTS